MMTDKVLANLGISSGLLSGGDTGKRRVEHRSFNQLRFTHYLEIGHPQAGAFLCYNEWNYYLLSISKA